MHSSVIELRSRVERDSLSVMTTPNIFLILGVDSGVWMRTFLTEITEWRVKRVWSLDRSGWSGRVGKVRFQVSLKAW